MSLADELLADLEEAAEEGEDGLYPGGEDDESDGEITHREGHGGLEDIPEEMEMDYSGTEHVTSIAKLRNSKSVSVALPRISVCLCFFFVRADCRTEWLGGRWMGGQTGGWTRRWQRR